MTTHDRNAIAAGEIGLGLEFIAGGGITGVTCLSGFRPGITGRTSEIFLGIGDAIIGPGTDARFHKGLAAGAGGVGIYEGCN